jgi:hypothetical protein
VLNRLTLLARVDRATQKIEVIGTTPSVQLDGETATVLFPEGDGAILSTTSRAIADMNRISSIQFGPFGLIVVSKES